MPHTTPRLLASTTRRWPPICRQNLGGGERGRGSDPSRPSSLPPEPWGLGQRVGREQGRLIGCVSHASQRRLLCCTDGEALWGAECRVRLPPGSTSCGPGPATGTRGDLTFSNEWITKRRADSHGPPWAGPSSLVSPWSSLALGDLLGTELGAPCSHQKGGCPRFYHAAPSGWPHSTSWF